MVPPPHMQGGGQAFHKAVMQGRGPMPGLAYMQAGDGAVKKLDQVFPEARASKEDEQSWMVLEDAAELPARSFEVPKSVYGGAAFAWNLRKFHTFEDWVIHCGQAWVRLALSHVVQIMLICGVWQLAVWQQDALDGEQNNADGNCDGECECWKIPWWLFFICEWIFVVCMMKELVMCFHMTELILFVVPTTEDSKVFRYVKDEEFALVRKDGGMSVCRKWVIFSVVLVPRFIIAFALTYIGGWFLQTALSNEDLFMNSLAAVFVIEIDEMLFDFLTPAGTRRLLEEMPPFEQTREETSLAWKALHDFSFVLKLIASAGLVAFFSIRRADRDCPHNPCNSSAPWAEGSVINCIPFAYPD